MGCGSSKRILETVDDSVHVMLQHDKKAAAKKGKEPAGYVPRAEHPLLQKAAQQSRAAATAAAVEQVAEEERQAEEEKKKAASVEATEEE